MLRREYPEEALVEEVVEDEVLVVDVGVVVTEGVVEMTIVVVVVVAEEWKLVLGTGTAHRVET